MEIVHRAAPCHNVPVTFTLAVMRSTVAHSAILVIAVDCSGCAAKRSTWVAECIHFEHVANMIELFSLEHHRLPQDLAELVEVGRYVKRDTAFDGATPRYRYDRLGERRFRLIGTAEGKPIEYTGPRPTDAASQCSIKRS